MTKRSKIPTDAKRIAIRPLALGERTGHHHSLVTDGSCVIEDAVEMYEVEKDGVLTTYMRVTAEGVSLVHQQHKAHAIPPGEYVYVPQVENSDWGTQRVAD